MRRPALLLALLLAGTAAPAMAQYGYTKPGVVPPPRRSMAPPPVWHDGWLYRAPPGATNWQPGPPRQGYRPVPQGRNAELYR